MTDSTRYLKTKMAASPSTKSTLLNRILNTDKMKNSGPTTNGKLNVSHLQKQFASRLALRETNNDRNAEFPSVTPSSAFDTLKEEKENTIVEHSKYHTHLIKKASDRPVQQSAIVYHPIDKNAFPVIKEKKSHRYRTLWKQAISQVIDRNRTQRPGAWLQLKHLRILKAQNSAKRIIDDVQTSHMPAVPHVNYDCLESMKKQIALYDADREKLLQELGELECALNEISNALSEEERESKPNRDFIRKLNMEEETIKEHVNKKEAKLELLEKSSRQIAVRIRSLEAKQRIDEETKRDARDCPGCLVLQKEVKMLKLQAIDREQHCMSLQEEVADLKTTLSTYIKLFEEECAVRRQIQAGTDSRLNNLESDMTQLDDRMAEGSALLSHRMGAVEKKMQEVQELNAKMRDDVYDIAESNRMTGDIARKVAATASTLKTTQDSLKESSDVHTQTLRKQEGQLTAVLQDVTLLTRTSGDRFVKLDEATHSLKSKQISLEAQVSKHESHLSSLNHDLDQLVQWANRGPISRTKA
eukprot:GILJ01013036.1.p1 GENE.GILJ01013036.1~~GILJ01013036.1.p1  ORF type:complete len:528 (-),score=103.95 GILJ01013036.1:125-1708(-)